MKTKVIIERGEVNIILTPENEFEKDIIEKSQSDKWKKSINVYCDYTYSTYSKHEIKINLQNNG